MKDHRHNRNLKVSVLCPGPTNVAEAQDLLSTSQTCIREQLSSLSGLYLRTPLVFYKTNTKSRSFPVVQLLSVLLHICHLK